MITLLASISSFLKTVKLIPTILIVAFLVICFLLFVIGSALDDCQIQLKRIANNLEKVAKSKTANEKSGPSKPEPKTS